MQPTPKNASPPRWATYLLRRLGHPDHREEVEGDLAELYAYWVHSHGPRRANWRYTLNALHLLRPFAKPKYVPEYTSPHFLSPVMLSNYLKIAFRTLRRHKLYTALNVAGLTFGLTCFLLIGLYLFDELTFDQHHQNASRIYRAIQHKKTPTEDLTIAASSFKVADEAAKRIGEIENSARIVQTGRANLTNPATKNAFQEIMAFGTPGLFQLFDFETVDGDGQSALNEPNSIVIVEELAQRLFGSTQVVGKTVDFELDKPLKITAVLKNHPRNSSLDFKVMISEATVRSDTSFLNWNADWTSQAFMTYFLLKENATPAVAATNITNLLNANRKPEPGTSVRYTLQPLTDIHLHSEAIVDRTRSEGTTNQDVLLYVRLFGVVGLFVLLIACINYMNLTTARAANRSKEIGVRKANGAFQHHLIYQFLTESLVVTATSFVLAVGLVNLLLPFVNTFTDKTLSLGVHSDYRIWLYALLAVVGTAVAAGSYPAFMMSRFSPLLLLKNLRRHTKGDLSLRQGLVVFQFTISVVMIIATIVLFQQIRYANSKELGFNKELLLVVDINSRDIRRNAETIKTELSRISTIKNVSTTSRVPGEWKRIPTVKIRPNGSTDEHKVAYLIGADERFAETFGVKLLAGRLFSDPTDSTSVVLNETAAKRLGISQVSGQLVDMPERAMGGSYRPVNESKEPFRARVIGIVSDFHFQSLREKIAPLVLAYQTNPVLPIDYFTARIDGHDIPTTLTRFNDVLTKVDPTHLLEHHFLDEQLALFYADDQRRQTLLVWVALATIFIACLGLFGLATYAAEQRVKEIGVRKVLGASVVNLTALLSKDFLKLVLIANGLAFPIAWWATNQWLNEFAYHIDVQWWVFAVSGTLAVGVALLTVSYQSIRAALMNPVKSLRSE
jgi:putative ABC transport system permease protein